MSNFENTEVDECDYDEESFYGSESEDENQSGGDAGPRNINYLLRWRPDRSKSQKKKLTSQEAASTNKNDQGYYRNWFLPANIDIQIVYYSNTKGLVLPPETDTNSHIYSYQNPSPSFVNLEGEPPRLARQISQLNAFHKRKSCNKPVSFASQLSTEEDEKSIQKLQTQSSVRFTVGLHEGMPDEFSSRPTSSLPRIPILNPYLYVMTVQHEDFIWTLRKRFTHFSSLHDRILFQKTLLMLHVPTTDSSADRQNLEHERAEEDAIGIGQCSSPNPLSRRHVLPRFPRRYDVFVKSQDFDDRVAQMEKYIATAVNIKRIRNNPDLCKFLEVSPISFIPSLGAKLKEGFVMKQSHWCGGTRSCFPFIHRKLGPRYKRWFFLKETCIGYFDPKKWAVSSVILFDEKFCVRCGFAFTGVKNGLKITSSGRALFMKCSSERQMNEWFAAIHNTKITSGKNFSSTKRFGSFAPLRENIHIKWYVDGLSYFESVAKCLEDATEEIFICDWWLSPEIHLKRPYSSDRYRIDELLYKKAKEGVMVYILLYKEIELTISINSAYTKRTLTNLHPNIKVMRHPDHLRGGVLMWAHHEKMVIIDQKIAFIGGLDICFGRWDTTEHVMSDFDGDHWSPDEKTRNVKFDLPSLMKGKDSVDGCIRGITSFHDPVNRLHSHPGHFQFLSPSLPTRPAMMSPIAEAPENIREITSDENIILEPGLSLGYKTEFKRRNSRLAALKRSNTNVLQSGSISSVMEQLMTNATGFEERRDGQLFVKVKMPPSSVIKALHRSTTVNPQSNRNSPPLLTKKGKREFSRQFKSTVEGTPSEALEGAIPGVDIPGRKTCAKRMYSLRRPDEGTDVAGPSHPLAIAPFARAWRAAKDFTEALRVDFSSSESSAEDEEKETFEEYQRIIWAGKDYVNWLEKDVTNPHLPNDDLIDRGKIPRMPWHDIGACVYGRAARDAARHFIQRWNAVKFEKTHSQKSIPYLLPKSYDKTAVPRALIKDAYASRVQILRSACPWSAGTGHTEKSILEAYRFAIFQAEHYVYIENQFFISNTVDNDLVFNGIARALFDRIIWANKMNRPFRVYINIPLLPAFEGKIGPNSGVSIQAVFHYIKRTICNGPYSLFEQLRSRQIDPSEYIFVGSLRNYGKISGTLVTEMVYIHSKLLIVDDRIVILGSANINDRSMLGFRDGEVAIISEDTNLVDGILGGQHAKIGAYAASLRVALMREHLGVSVHYRSSVSVSSMTEGDSFDPSGDVSLTENDTFKGEGGNVKTLDWDYDLLADPVSDVFFKGVWQRTALANTDIYTRVFNVIPCDEVATYAELEVYRLREKLSEKNPSLSENLLQGIRGYLVACPLDFLKEENIEPKAGSKEAWLPYQVWC